MSKGGVALLLSVLYIGAGVGLYFYLTNKNCKPLDKNFEDEQIIKSFHKFMDIKDPIWYKGSKIEGTSRFGKWDCKTNNAYREHAGLYWAWIQQMAKK